MNTNREDRLELVSSGRLRKEYPTRISTISSNINGGGLFKIIWKDRNTVTIEKIAEDVNRREAEEWFEVIPEAIVLEFWPE